MRLTRAIYKLQMKKTDQACLKFLKVLSCNPVCVVATKIKKTSLQGVHPQSNTMEEPSSN